ncbi:PqqD family protein [Terrisporobacter vanillatitrophus]|uniref:PqqD family protein n=1 Tax=Terrisporobacter vanillatitrophus TaxID=3058402 RepID=UPI003367B4C6
MKIKKEFCMRNICGENTLVPIGETASSFKGIIKVNNIGSFIWNSLESAKNEDEIVSMVMDKYSLDLREARSDVDGFIKYLKNVNII